MNSQINTGLNKIRNIVSDEWIKINPEEIVELTQSTLPVNHKPLGFVYPKDSSEIKLVLEIANEHGIPIWPVSKGNNWGFGSLSAAQEGNLIMVLERMNKILEVDEELAYAVVEPGVTYADLHRYLEDNNIDLMCDPVEGPIGCSILGNALERGRGRTNYGDHFANLCGVEIILPNGKVLKTGGGPDNSRGWNVFKYGVGPSIDGLFTQGNYGIAVKGGVLLMPKPEVCVSVFVEIPSDEAFVGAVDAFRTLQLEGTIESKMAVGNDCFVLSSLVDCPELFVKGSYMTDERLNQLRSEYSIGKWSSASAVYGSKEMVRVKLKRIKQLVSPHGKLRFVSDRKFKLLSRLVERHSNGERFSYFDSFAAWVIQTVTGKQIKMFAPLTHMHKVHSGIPSDAIIKSVNYGEPTKIGSDNYYNMNLNRTGMFWCIPVVPLHGNELLSMNTRCKEIAHQRGFDYSAGIMLLNERSVIVLMKIAFDKENHEQVEKARELFNAYYDWCIDHGYQVYRTNVEHMKSVTECAPVYREFVNQIKLTVDPNNIIAPGKYGVG